MSPLFPLIQSDTWTLMVQLCHSLLNPLALPVAWHQELPLLLV